MEREIANRMLMQAYSNKDYQLQLYAFKDEIDEIITQLIVDVKNKNNNLNIFEDPHSRVKKIKSFSEKIVRKNYFKWIKDEHETQESIQEKINLNLTDIIGFRINCYFFKEEEIVYNTIKSIIDEINQQDDEPDKYREIVLDFTENTHQENGRIIYKFSGIYKDQIKFEVQIKSMIKDLWAEVEHHTTYKAKRIDSKINIKERIQNDSLIILESVDRELEFLYNDLSEQHQLIRELFFQYTFNEISEKNKEINIVPAYLIFFNLITRLDLVKDLNHFVGHCLTDTSFTKSIYKFSMVSDNDLLVIFDNFNSKVFSAVLDIFDFLYIIESNRNLTYLLAEMYIKEKDKSKSISSADSSDVFSDIPENNDSDLSLTVFLRDLGIKEV